MDFCCRSRVVTAKVIEKLSEIPLRFSTPAEEAQHDAPMKIATNAQNDCAWDLVALLGFEPRFDG